LFAALEDAFRVSFEGREAGEWSGLDGAILLDVSTAEGPTCPAFLTASSPGEPVSRPVELGFDAALDPTVRGASLHQSLLGRLEGGFVGADDTVLASCGGSPVWVRRSSALVELVATGLDELADGEILRDRLCPGRFLGLLALAHFLRRLTGESASTRPPLRAAFLFDDPNLHWTSYGHMHFGQLAAHAAEHGYHASIAMIPLDGFFTHPVAARLFRDNRRLLSLVVHGNNHVREELFRTTSPACARAVIAEALRRTRAFEQRTTIGVDRVMCAPHERCSEAALRALLELGFEALCSQSPFPWSPRRPPPDYPLAGWEPAQFLAGGFPVLPRYELVHSRDDLVFRAFLGQPLVLFGHQWNLADGLDPLAEAAAQVNALGDVEWCSMSSIARSNVALRPAGRVLGVRLFSRSVSVTIPAGVEELAVELPAVHGALERLRVISPWGEAMLEPRTSSPSTAVLPVRGGVRADIEVRLPSALEAEEIAAPPWRPWPVMRRVLTEGRDRAYPLAGRLRGRRSVNGLGNASAGVPQDRSFSPRSR